MPIPSLTSQAAMERLLSEHGVTSWADNDADGQNDDGIVDDAIAYADAYVGGALVQRYQPQYLVNSAVVCKIATVIACWDLCQTRGNPVPDSLEARYHQITDEGGLLERLAAGVPKLIDASGNPIPGKASYVPTHSNLVVDRRYSQNTIRVENNSSSQVASKLPRDIEYGGFSGQY